MLDPLTALSVAGTVVQLTDFSLKLASKVKEIFESADGVLIKNAEYETVAEDFGRLCARINPSSLEHSSGPPSKDDLMLQKLASDAESVSKELLALLRDLKGKEKESKLQSLGLVLKNVLKENQIESISKRLENIRSEINTNILIKISENADLISVRQSQLQTSLDDTTRVLLNTLIEDRACRTRAAEKGTIEIFRSKMSLRRDIDLAKAEILDAIRLATWESTSTSWEKRSSDNMTSIDWKNSFKDYVLSSLRYQAMTERLDDIPEAHKSTLQWLYEPPPGLECRWDDLSVWLARGNGIYWVQGKAGSGKSCLMKYVHDQPQTAALLSKWAGVLPLVKAGFFFWYPGTLMQKSQNGLLRSILYQVLEKEPRLTPLAYEQIWQQYNGTGDKLLSLSRGELIRAVTRITTQQVFPLKPCLIIDGLDEYDGDHQEIVDLFETMTKSPTTKILVSSRPWLLFKNAFIRYPKLILQDLTREDIRRYAETILSSSSRMVELQKEEPLSANTLVGDIVEKSSGVFLWVKLVVRSLLSGLMNNDCIDDLNRRLEELPSDLERLYIFILKRIDPFYLKQAIRLFRIVCQSRRPLPTLAVSFANDFDPKQPITPENKVMSSLDTAKLCVQVEDRIQSQCLGLLECVVGGNRLVSGEGLIDDTMFLDGLMYYAKFQPQPRRVQFMHRSVKEFFDKPGTWNELRSPLHDDESLYDAYQALSFSSLMQLKNVFASRNYGSWASAYRPFAALVRECMDYAAEAERSTEEAQTRIIEELRKAAAFHYDEGMKLSGMRKSKTWVHTVLPNHPADRSEEPMFLALAMSRGLKLYLGDYLHDLQCPNSQLIQFLITDALSSKHKDPKIVALLFSKGADPNSISDGYSPWQRMLVYVWDGVPQRRGEKERQKLIENSHEILENMILSGADPHYICERTSAVSTQQPDRASESLPALAIIIRTGNSRLVTLLLDHNADPNFEHNRLTSWQEALRYAHQEIPKFIDNRANELRISEWLKIFNGLLDYDADPRALVNISPVSNSSGLAGSRSVSVLSVINDVFSKWDPEGADSLRSRLPDGLAADLRRLQSSGALLLSKGRLLPSLELPAAPSSDERPLASSSPALLLPPNSPLSPVASLSGASRSSSEDKKSRRRSFTKFLSILKK